MFHTCIYKTFLGEGVISWIYFGNVYFIFFFFGGGGFTPTTPPTAITPLLVLMGSKHFEGVVKICQRFWSMSSSHRVQRSYIKSHFVFQSTFKPKSFLNANQHTSDMISFNTNALTLGCHLAPGPTILSIPGVLLGSSLISEQGCPQNGPLKHDTQGQATQAQQQPKPLPLLDHLPYPTQDQQDPLCTRPATETSP